MEVMNLLHSKRECREVGNNVTQLIKMLLLPIAFIKKENEANFFFKKNVGFLNWKPCFLLLAVLYELWCNFIIHDDR